VAEARAGLPVTKPRPQKRVAPIIYDSTQSETDGYFDGTWSGSFEASDTAIPVS
jgi:hypothetical protein